MGYSEQCRCLCDWVVQVGGQRLVVIPHSYDWSAGGMAEWSMAVVLKTTKVQAFGGSNPSPSARAFFDGASRDRLNTKTGPRGRFSAFSGRCQKRRQAAEKER